MYTAPWSERRLVLVFFAVWMAAVDYTAVSYQDAADDSPMAICRRLGWAPRDEATLAHVQVLEVNYVPQAHDVWSDTSDPVVGGVLKEAWRALRNAEHGGHVDGELREMKQAAAAAASGNTSSSRPHPPPPQRDWFEGVANLAPPHLRYYLLGDDMEVVKREVVDAVRHCEPPTLMLALGLADHIYDLGCPVPGRSPRGLAASVSRIVRADLLASRCRRSASVGCYDQFVQAPPVVAGEVTTVLDAGFRLEPYSHAKWEGAAPSYLNDYQGVYECFRLRCIHPQRALAHQVRQGQNVSADRLRHPPALYAAHVNLTKRDGEMCGKLESKIVQEHIRRENRLRAAPAGRKQSLKPWLADIFERKDSRVPEPAAASSATWVVLGNVVFLAVAVGGGLSRLRRRKPKSI